MFRPGLIKYLYFIIFMIFVISGCQSLEKRCLPDQSVSCKLPLANWQESIDQIVKTNFPPDYGFYKAVIWNEEFDNAWVTKGREVNITKSFLEKLNPIRRLCVAAHELAHLKMGHYYSRIGIVIVNPGTELPKNNITSTTDHYGPTSSVDIPEGFGINQEIEADRMALKLIKNMGLNANHYLDLLLLLQGKESDPDSLIYYRIAKMKKLRLTN
jgi:hypothetical protein